MKVAVVTDWFAEKMGYSENLFSKALAKLGVETHVVSSDLQPWYPNYKEAYEPFIGPRLQSIGAKSLHGFTLHRLPHGREDHGIYIRGLHGLMARLRPAVVQCLGLHSWCTVQSALSKPILGYKLFVQDSTHASVFPPPAGIRARARQSVWRTYGRIISACSERCYAIAPDSARIATEHFGFSSRKILVRSLGVDTDFFCPTTTDEQRQERRRIRSELGYKEEDIVAVYSGRLSVDKNPLCLAQAVDLLQGESLPFRALIIGQGRPEDVDPIKRCRGAVVHPFVEWFRLPPLYRAADVGVWPRQESTSQLDAAACGLPLILSDHVEVRERVEGNGFLYKQDDPADLARRLRALLDPNLRIRMGKAGAEKVRDQFSWDRIARERLRDYEAALSGRKLPE